MNYEIDFFNFFPIQLLFKGAFQPQPLVLSSLLSWAPQRAVHHGLRLLGSAFNL